MTTQFGFYKDGKGNYFIVSIDDETTKFLKELIKKGNWKPLSNLEESYDLIVYRFNTAKSVVWTTDADEVLKIISDFALIKKISVGTEIF